MNLVLSRANPMLLFGCGNMGRAMLRGWLASGIDPASFVIVDPFATHLPEHVRHCRDASELDQVFALALLAVKPQMLDEVAPALEKLLSRDALVLSILAGTRIEALERQFPGRHLVRVMPNLAASLGKSPLGLLASEAIDRYAIDALLQPLGEATWLEDESLMDAMTALAGSGPAFVYRFIDAMAQAGVALGLDADKAERLALLVVQGSAELAMREEASAAELARRVTSKGGTTEAGLAVLDADDILRKLLSATLAAACDRSVELSQRD